MSGKARFFDILPGLKAEDSKNKNMLDIFRGEVSTQRI